MINIFLGPFALGIIVGAVAVLIAVCCGAEIVAIPTRREGTTKDFFYKPIKVVTIENIRPGDFIHDIADPASLLDIEKRRGYVISIASQIEPRRIILRLTGRRTLLEVPADANAVITSVSPPASQGMPRLQPHHSTMSY